MRIFINQKTEQKQKQQQQQRQQNKTKQNKNKLFTERTANMLATLRNGAQLQ